MIVRASDVPTYVAHGAADVGVAGKDVLLEQGGEGLYQPLDLEIARCRMVVATQARLRLGGHRPARRAHSRRDEVRADGARALRRQGRARRPDQAVRLDGARAAVRSRRRDRRSRELRPHARRQRSRRRRGHRADQRAARRQSGRAQAEARARAADARSDRRRRSRPRGAQRRERGRPRGEQRARERRRARAAPSRCGDAGFERELAALTAFEVGAGSRRSMRPSRASSPTSARAATSRCSSTRARSTASTATSVAALEIPPTEMRDAFDALPETMRAALQTAAARIRAFHERQKLASWSYRDADGSEFGQRVTRARPRRHLRAGRQGRVPVVGADERDPGARRRRRRKSSWSFRRLVARAIRWCSRPRILPA